MNVYTKNLKEILEKSLYLMIVSIFFSSCSPVQSFEQVEPRKEYYKVKTSRYAKDPVYSRVAFSQLPRPIPEKNLKSKLYLKQKTPSLNESKLILPDLEVSLPNSNLLEALEALSQTIDYELKFSKKHAKTPVSLEMTASLEDILKEIRKQTGIQTVLDHKQRVLRVFKTNVKPRLPK